MSWSKIKTWILLPVILVIGVGVGLSIPLQQIRNTISAIFELDENKDAAEDEPDAPVIVEITETAHKSLGLKIRRAALGNYVSTFDVPATLRELPGAASIKISSRFTGLIKRVYVSEGQSVRAGDSLFEIELTGESLSQAQADLLLAIKKVENISEELKRLEPLIQQGGLANKRFLELRYDQKQLEAEVNAKQQELLLLGLSEIQIRQIALTRKLLRRLNVVVPENLLPPQLNLPEGIHLGNQATFVLEKFDAKPGQIVASGADLCHLAFHEVLVVEGHAFEKDLAQLKQISDQNQNVAVALGTFDDAHKMAASKIAFVSNHANPDSNTYPFFVYLKNQAETGQNLTTPVYLGWRWKPGQLAHIELPKKSFENMLVLPREAVAEDGVSKIVFEWKGQIQHDHSGDEMEDHEHADEYKPVEVQVVYMDRDVAIVHPEGNLKEGTRIAFNNANQLLFALQSGTGSAHGHEH